jgi:signal transduction histidine kinase
MKTTIIRTSSTIKIALLIVLLINANAAYTQAQNNKGLLNRLIEIKYTGELYLSTKLKNKNEERNDSAQAIYNTLRWKLDGLVYQLSSEMIATNSPRKMRLLNEWCLNENKNIVISGKYKTIAHNIQELKDIEKYYEENIANTMYAQNKNINLSTNIFYLIKDSYTVVKGLSDLQTEKTMALIELLDHTRLLSAGEVMKQGK